MEISAAPDYVIHENGEIWSKERLVQYENGKIHNRKSQLRKPYVNCNYLQVGLTVDKKQKHFFVHRLVATAFIPNPNNLPCVNHKNGDRQDNRIDNLEWCTQNYNTQSINTKKNFGTIYKKPNNTYRAKYSSNKIKYSKYFKTEAEAEIWLILEEIIVRVESQLI